MLRQNLEEKNTREIINELINYSQVDQLDRLLNSLSTEALNLVINEYLDTATPLLHAIRTDKIPKENNSVRMMIINLLLKHGANPTLYYRGRHSDLTAIDFFFLNLKLIKINTAVLKTATTIISVAARISKSQSHEFIKNRPYPLLHYLLDPIKWSMLNENELTRIFKSATTDGLNLNTTYKIIPAYHCKVMVGEYGLAYLANYLLRNDYDNELGTLLASAINAGMILDSTSFEIAELSLTEKSRTGKNISIIKAITELKLAEQILTEHKDPSSRFSTLSYDVIGMISNHCSAFFFDNKISEEKDQRLKKYESAENKPSM